MKRNSKYIVGFLIAVLFGFGLFFTNYSNVIAEENETTETIGALEDDTEYTEDVTEEPSDPEVILPREEDPWHEVIEDLKEYKIDFSKISRAIEKEKTKLEELSFRRIFGNYNSFYEAVDMSKRLVLLTVAGIFVLCIVLYIIMRFSNKR